MKARSDDLQLLLSVVDCGGFSAAAEALDLQVAKVSRAISRLEKQLNVTLLNRTTRRVELTEEGRRYIAIVRKGLEQLQMAEEELVTGEQTPKGKLRVDAASPFTLHQLVPLIGAFSLAYPEIELELTSHEGYIDLLENRTDLAIRVGKLKDSSLHARHLGDSPLFIVASPGYLASHGTPKTIAELSEHQTLGFVAPKVLNHWPLGVGVDISPSITASNGEIVRQLVLASNGIACLSRFMVGEDIAAGRLVSLLENERIKDHNREPINAVFYKTSAVSRRISVFLDYIQPRLTL
ncbi:LysR family transcriptional regulator [Corallincola holothuriorum]|uniref:LysR family transcriptional regulator n=1 Tax=Corallincola holothuriorum TaxID=2282215 RepID=A0A368NN34_9GAMM|nr:LysR family transcriptional regulator [Corallincola holothuriorum]RCU51566.1 LysR family transcriptional regulator [Corallincola holothuriorum]